MGESSANEQAGMIKAMFSRIAGKYRLVNRWMTWWQDEKWRREVLRLAQIPSGGRILDVGTGTGDLALQAIEMDSSLHIVGADFTHRMMLEGRSRYGGERVSWLNTNALELPFSAETFDAVVSGFLLRNVVDINRALTEQHRVLKRGGYVVSLDTSPPPADLWHIPVRLYLKLGIPLIGGLITGDWKAYTYLPNSTQRFLQAEELKNHMVETGFHEVTFKSFMGGSIAIHWGIR